MIGRPWLIEFLKRSYDIDLVVGSNESFVERVSVKQMFDLNEEWQGEPIWPKKNERGNNNNVSYRLSVICCRKPLKLELVFKVKIASMTRIGLTKMIETLISFKPVIPLDQSQVRDPGRRMQVLFEYF